MTRTYTTKDGDVLDEVVAEFYGRTSGVVEQVLEHNRSIGLADNGPVLPVGVVISLPDIAEPSEAPAKLIRLWE